MTMASLSRAEWIAYGIAVVVLLAVMWKRIGEWDRAHDDRERRRNRTP